MVYSKNKSKPKLVIHITGSQGSGKTTIGKYFTKTFGDAIVVEDIDDLQAIYASSNHHISFQAFLNKFIKSTKKPLVLVGLTAEKCLGEMNPDDERFYIIDTPYRFYLDMNDEIILRQRFYRQIDKLSERKEYFFEEWKKNPDKTIKKLIRFININQWLDNNKLCRDFHTKYGYIFKSSKDIINEVEAILNAYLLS